jgi:hypothetical protein
MRVLQTLALPLGHDAILTELTAYLKSTEKKGRAKPDSFFFGLLSIAKLLIKNQSGRWDSNPRPSPWQGDVLPLNHARNSWPVFLAESAESQNRTDDTAIFSRVLYQLSYLGQYSVVKRPGFY